MVHRIACRFVQPKTDIVDLGCSRGVAVEPLIRKFGAANRFVLCDSAPAMLEVCRSKFSGYETSGVMRILDHDLRSGAPHFKASVVLAVLTLQFVPIEYRHRVVKQAFDRIVDGGAMIVVEKVLGDNANAHELVTSEYLAYKEAQGYTGQEIDAKRHSLENVLVPVTAKWNEDLLRSAGFEVECFWRWMNFAGWVAVKEARG